MQAPLSIERIHEVADELAAAGQRPTLAAVREALGGGSFTTISEGMKLWRKQAAEHEQLLPLVEALPDVLQQAALTTAAAVWREAQALASSRLEAERQALAQAQEALEAEQAETVELVALLERDLESLRAELADVVKKAADAEVVSSARITKVADERDSVKAELTQATLRAERADAQVVEIERRAEDLRLELDRSHRDADKAQEALAELREVAEKRLADLEHGKARVSELEAQYKRMHDYYQQSAEDLVKAREKESQLIESFEKAQAQGEEKLEKTRAEVDALTAELADSKAAHAELAGTVRAYETLIARFELGTEKKTKAK